MPSSVRVVRSVRVLCCHVCPQHSSTCCARQIGQWSEIQSACQHSVLAAGARQTEVDWRDEGQTVQACRWNTHCTTRSTQSMATASWHTSPNHSVRSGRAGAADSAVPCRHIHHSLSLACAHMRVCTRGVRVRFPAAASHLRAGSSTRMKWNSNAWRR